MVESDIKWKRSESNHWPNEKWNLFKKLRSGLYRLAALLFYNLRTEDLFTIVRIRQINRPRLESFSAGEAIVGQTERLYVSPHSLGNSSTVDGDSSRALPDSVFLKDKKRRNTSDF